MGEVEKLVTSLCNSEESHHLVIENFQDVDIYRQLVERRGIPEVKIHASGGRSELLSVYERRGEFSHLPVAFVANQGMWLFTRISEGYEDLILTEGFSLENDVYAGASLERLLERHETPKHLQMLTFAIVTFALEVENYNHGYLMDDFQFEDVVPPSVFEPDVNFRKRIESQPPDPKLVQYIKAEYQLRLRGDWLFQILTRFLNASGRDFKFDITPHSLYHIALMMPKMNFLLDNLMRKVEKKLNEQKQKNT